MKMGWKDGDEDGGGGGGGGGGEGGESPKSFQKCARTLIILLLKLTLNRLTVRMSAFF